MTDTDTITQMYQIMQYIILFHSEKLASLPVLIQPLISEMTPLLSILNRIIRVRGSKTCGVAYKNHTEKCINYNTGVQVKSAYMKLEQTYLFNCSSV